MKVRNVFYKLISIIFAMMMGFTFGVMLFLGKIIHHNNENLCSLSNIIYLAAGLLILAGGCLVYHFLLRKQIKAWSHKKCVILLWVVQFIFVLIQIWIFSRIYFHSDWDCGTMDHVSEVVAGGSGFFVGDLFIDYFSRFPNNMFLLGILSMIKSIGMKCGLTDVYMPTVIISIICMNVSAILGILSARKLLADRDITVLVYVLMQILVGWNAWEFIPYTDVFSVLFASLVLYLYLTRDAAASRCYRWLLISLFSMLGYYMKPSSCIVFIAILIYEMIGFNRSKGKMAIRILLTFVCAAILTGAIQMSIRQYVGIPTDSDKAFNMLYFVMLGLGENATGAYDEAELQYAMSFDTSKERQDGIRNRIVDNLRQKGIKGLLVFEVKKLLLNYDDGSFFWGREGDFFLENEDRTLQADTVSCLLKKYYYMENNTWLPVIMQTVWVVVLCLTVIAAVLLLNQKPDEKWILCLSIIGITLFTLLFEGRSRYLLTYVPYYVILAGVGLQELYRLKNEK